MHCVNLNHYNFIDALEMFHYRPENNRISRYSRWLIFYLSFYSFLFVQK